VWTEKRESCPAVGAMSLNASIKSSGNSSRTRYVSFSSLKVFTPNLFIQSNSSSRRGGGGEGEDDDDDDEDDEELPSSPNASLPSSLLQFKESPPVSNPSSDTGA
jgi:hypothetical protein